MSQGDITKINPLSFTNRKLKWLGDFDLFEKFVNDILNIKGEWKVPRGGCKQLKTKDITVRWYENRSVLLDGPMKDEYSDILQRIATISPNNISNLGVDDFADVSPTHMPSLPNINNSMVNTNMSNAELLDFDASQNDSAHFSTNNGATNGSEQTLKEIPLCVEGNALDDVMNRLNALSNEFEKYKSETTIVLNELVDGYEIRNSQVRDNQLAQENDLLKKANMALKSDVYKLECLLSETSSKLVAAESEKASLVTVIRLMNEDCANAVKDVGDNVRSQMTQPRNPWCTVHTRSENQKGNEVTRLHNQFSSLEDEANELNNNSDFDASVINIDSDIQQPTPSQNMSESTSKFTEPKDDRTQGTSGNSDRVPKKGIALIGDSIIKNVSPVKLSKRKVYKFTYPGKTTIEITNELAKINIKPDPSHVVIHAGTNDVPVESIDECVGNMEKLITTAKQKFPNSKIGISGLTLRQDSDLISKIEDINEKVQSLSSKHGVTFISNMSIDETCLNSSGLHLNAKGTAILATHFIKFLRDGQSLSSLRPQKHSRQDFPKNTINHLAELLNAIMNLNK